MFSKIALIGSVAVNCMFLLYFFYNKGESAQLNSQVPTSNTSSITEPWITCTNSDGSLETESFIPDERYSSFEQYLNSPEALAKKCRMASEGEKIAAIEGIKTKAEIDVRLKESVEFNPRRDF